VGGGIIVNRLSTNKEMTLRMHNEQPHNVFQFHPGSAPRFAPTFVLFPATFVEECAVTMTTMTSLHFDPFLQGEWPGDASLVRRICLPFGPSSHKEQAVTSVSLCPGCISYQVRNYLLVI
jgi:hypothetical protein